MTRVLHTGDTHIGYRQYHSPERRADFLDAFRGVVEDAVEDQVDAVVHAGDLFHDRRPALGDIHGTIEILRDLRAADIPFFAVVGNHERTRGQQWLDLFETLGLATRLDRSPEIVGDVALYGLDFVPRSRREALDYEFEPHDADHAALVSHGLFEPFAHADWNTRTVLESANIDFDVLLLGDNHDPGREKVAGTWVTYCGSTERTDATEREERGYNLVSFEGEVTIARRGIETRPFGVIELDMAPGEGADRVRSRLREEALEDAVVVVSISGDGEPVSVAELESFAVEEGALVARVTDRREFEAAEVEAVRFADPDQAVEDRLRGLGLSDAALAIDDHVRDLEVAKTNVRDRVKTQVEKLLDDDPEALEPADTDGPASDPADESPASEPEPGSQEPASGGPELESDSRSADESGPTDTEPAEPDAPADASGSSEDDGATAADGAEDQQVTMEDYL
ncbi:MAG: DNA double-strand break repair protein Mre11 [Halobacteriales archaeon]